MKKLILILAVIFISFDNSANDIKIKDVCEWHHEEIIGWHQNSILFRKRLIEVSDKSKYPDADDKTIERNLLKQEKLLKRIISFQNYLMVSLKELEHHYKFNKVVTTDVLFVLFHLEEEKLEVFLLEKYKID